MKSRFYLILLSIIFLLSCKKKMLPYIEIGNPFGMDITTLNINGAINLDVNQDGKNDIAFSTSYSYSPGGGAQGKVEIKLLNDKILLMGTPYDDTTFVKKDTVIHGFAPVYVEMRSIYFHSRKSPYDSIESINHYPFIIKSLSPSILLNQTDKFINTSSVLQEHDGIGRTSYFSKDTTFNYWSNRKTNLNPYPWNRDIFFGFKINAGGGSRLGWIKFIILGEGEVKIIETAIQKN